MRYLMGIQPFIVSKACQLYHWFPAIDRGWQILLQNHAKSASRQYHTLGTVSVPRSFTYMQLKSDQWALNSCGPVSSGWGTTWNVPKVGSTHIPASSIYPFESRQHFSNIFQQVSVIFDPCPSACRCCGSQWCWRQLIPYAPDNRSAEILWQSVISTDIVDSPDCCSFQPRYLWICRWATLYTMDLYTMYLIYIQSISILWDCLSTFSFQATGLFITNDMCSSQVVLACR
jgi:hypothetical protein